MSRMQTLADGSTVDDNSKAWRDECAAIHAHVMQLRSRRLAARRVYFDAVEKREGAEMRFRVALAYVADWNRRRLERDQAHEHQPGESA